jgi:hypothetical protein
MPLVGVTETDYDNHCKEFWQQHANYIGPDTRTASISPPDNTYIVYINHVIGIWNAKRLGARYARLRFRIKRILP